MDKVKLNLPLTIKVFREGSSLEKPFVAYNPEFDISSCGKTETGAEKMLKKAIELVLAGAKEDGTLNQVLEEAGFNLKKFQKQEEEFSPRVYFSVFNLPLSYA